ncbi:MAG: flagella basal body P-ring formation protein FlgA [Nitrospirae bacterium]|nr:MAG: flagella basal body P-ring formation protein FlgA [Nitrospirota bacterium]
MTALLMLAMLISWSPKQALEQHLLANYPWDSIVVENISYDGRMPAEKPVNILVQRGPVGNGVFLFEFPDGTFKKVHARVEAKQQVVKTVRPLKRGSILKKDDLYVGEVDVRHLPKNAITNPEDALGKVLKRTVRADMVLSEGMIRERPTIKKGQKVRIIYERPGIRLIAPGLAREDGYRGKSIKVLSLWSKKVLVGLVKDSSTVSLTP